jgi:hypothetical protein
MRSRVAYRIPYCEFVLDHRCVRAILGRVTPGNIPQWLNGMASSNSVHHGVPPKNYLAMVKTYHDYYGR